MNFLHRSQTWAAAQFERVRRYFGWTRSSYTIMGGFVLVVGLVGVVWWPLAKDYLSQVDWSGPWWRSIDWLLIGIFLAMSLLIMGRADLKQDILLIMVGVGGGLVIESWGTQTRLWTYYTLQRPPLWIIPAWPVAALAIDRLTGLFDALTRRIDRRWLDAAYWFVLPGFFVLMVIFVWPTVPKSLTLMAILLSGLIIATPKDARMALLIFLAGAALGYFLERWGTTRLCWTYYTKQKPPFFAVLAHGMASVAFWRVKLLIQQMLPPLRARLVKALPAWISTYGR